MVELSCPSALNYHNLSCKYIWFSWNEVKETNWKSVYLIIDTDYIHLYYLKSTLFQFSSFLPSNAVPLQSMGSILLSWSILSFAEHTHIVQHCLSPMRKHYFKITATFVRINFQSFSLYRRTQLALSIHMQGKFALSTIYTLKYLFSHNGFDHLSTYFLSYSEKTVTFSSFIIYRYSLLWLLLLFCLFPQHVNRNICCLARLLSCCNTIHFLAVWLKSDIITSSVSQRH